MLGLFSLSTICFSHLIFTSCDPFPHSSSSLPPKIFESMILINNLPPSLVSSDNSPPALPLTRLKSDFLQGQGISLKLEDSLLCFSHDSGKEVGSVSSLFLWPLRYHLLFSGFESMSCLNLLPCVHTTHHPLLTAFQPHTPFIQPRLGPLGPSFLPRPSTRAFSICCLLISLQVVSDSLRPLGL